MVRLALSIKARSASVDAVNVVQVEKVEYMDLRSLFVGMLVWASDASGAVLLVHVST